MASKPAAKADTVALCFLFLVWNGKCLFCEDTVAQKCQHRPSNKGHKKFGTCRQSQLFLGIRCGIQMGARFRGTAHYWQHNYCPNWLVELSGQHLPYVTDFHSPKVFSQPILLNHYRIFVHFSIFFHRFESTSLPHPDSKFQRYPRWAMEHRPCGLYRWCFLGADSGCFLRACRGDNGAKISTIFHGSLQ